MTELLQILRDCPFVGMRSRASRDEKTETRSGPATAGQILARHRRKSTWNLNQIRKNFRAPDPAQIPRRRIHSFSRVPAQREVSLRRALVRRAPRSHVAHYTNA